MITLLVAPPRTFGHPVIGTVVLVAAGLWALFVFGAATWIWRTSNSRGASRPGTKKAFPAGVDRCQGEQADAARTPGPFATAGADGSASGVTVGGWRGR